MTTKLITMAAIICVFGAAGCGDDPVGQQDASPDVPSIESDGGDHNPSDGGDDGGDGGDGSSDGGEDGGGDDGGDGSTDSGPDDHEPVSPSTSMMTGRAGHAAVRLADGRVMVIDGRGLDNAGALVEVFDPATEEWSTPEMTDTPSYPGNTAYLLPSGEVTVGQTSYSTNVCFYDPDTGVWRDGAYPSLITTSSFSTLLPSGRALTAGGYITGGTTVRDARRYDPEADTWLSSSLLEPRRSALAAAVDDRYALVIGGRNGLSDLFSAEIVDTETGESRYTGSPQSWFAEARFVVLEDGDLLMVGGNDFDKNLQHHVERYSFASGRWSVAEPIATARQEFTLTKLADGRVLAIGGRAKNYEALSSIEIYDPAKNEWRKFGELNTPRYRHQATLLADGRVLVTGGDGATDRMSSVEIVDPSQSCAADDSCRCEPESEALVCARHQSTCMAGWLMDRCGNARTVSCNSTPCTGSRECVFASDTSSRCAEKVTTGSRFHVELVSSSNEFQHPSAIGLDLEGLPVIVVQGSAIGPVGQNATALNTRLPSGQWVRQGLTSGEMNTSAFFASARAPQLLQVGSGTSPRLTLFQWKGNTWNNQNLGTSYGGAFNAPALVVDASDRPSFAWVQKAQTGSSFSVRYGWAEASLVTETIDSIAGGVSVDAALDAAGTPHVAYAGTTIGLMYATRTGINTWSKEDVDAAGGKRAKIFVDKNDRVQLVSLALEGANHEVRHATSDGSEWSVESWPLPSTNISEPMFAAASDGTIHAVWASFVAKDGGKHYDTIHYAIRTADGWAVEPVFHVANATTLLPRGFALTPEGKPLIAIQLSSSTYFATIR